MAGYELADRGFESLRVHHCLNGSSQASLRTLFFFEAFSLKSIVLLVQTYFQLKAVSETLQELANDKKYLGAQIGFTSILHTWGQNLKDHPHIHCIVPAGGLDILGKWRNSKKKFFIPVKVLSKVFRGKFIYYMKQEKLDFCKEIEDLKIVEEFDKFISSL